jgi:hypothetical protein
MIKCSSCEYENSPGSLFCSKCGTHLLMGKLLSTEKMSERDLPAEKRTPPGNDRASTPCQGSALDCALFFVFEHDQKRELPPVPTLNLGRGQIPDGTTPTLDLTLAGAYKSGVSRFHARLHRRPNGFYLEDLLSTNGTYINGRRIPPYAPQELRDGDKVELGRLAFKFQVGNDGTCST